MQSAESIQLWPKGLELASYIKMTKTCPTFETSSFVYSYYLPERWRFLSSKCRAYTYYKYVSCYN